MFEMSAVNRQLTVQTKMKSATESNAADSAAGQATDKKETSATPLDSESMTPSRSSASPGRVQ